MLLVSDYQSPLHESRWSSHRQPLLAIAPFGSRPSRYGAIVWLKPCQDMSVKGRISALFVLPLYTVTVPVGISSLTFQHIICRVVEFKEFEFGFLSSSRLLI
jgi:hypothetical protein